MSNDVLFKSKAFGGFRKDEVMAYIDRIFAEKAELQRQLGAANTNSARLNAKLRELTALSASGDADKAEIKALKEKTEALESEIAALNESLDSETQKRISAENFSNAMQERSDAAELLQARLDAAKAEINELRENAANASSDAEVTALKAENMRLKSECERIKALESQVGAAMLDARIRSDELVKDAREKANRVTQKIYSEIGDTAVKIDDLSTGISEIARNFTKAVEEVELRINALTGNMSKTAQALLADNTAENGDSLMLFSEPAFDSSDSLTPEADGDTGIKEAPVPDYEVKTAEPEVFTVPEGDTIVFEPDLGEETEDSDAEEIVPEVVYPDTMQYTDGEGGEIEFL